MLNLLSPCTRPYVLLLAGTLLAANVNAATPSYTTDLSVWGPHPETSLKQGLSEPRWMKLQDAEREKIGACSSGKNIALDVQSLLATEEVTIDIGAKHGGPARSRPAGELAKELFREQVQGVLEGYSKDDGWPDSWFYGSEIAEMYGRHFGYQFWREYYDIYKANPLDMGGGSIKLMHEIREQFWPLCMAQIPTACFEEGPADAKRCVSKLIHPKNFPVFDEVADLYQKSMTKPNGW